MQPTLLALVRRPAGSKAHVFLWTERFPNHFPNQAILETLRTGHLCVGLGDNDTQLGDSQPKKKSKRCN